MARNIYFSIILGLLTIPQAFGLDIDGKVFYVAQGNLVGRGVVLDLPAGGNGDIFLKSAAGKSVAAGSHKVNSKGRTVFYVSFKDFPGGDGKSQSVFRGTYLRGGNKALYYGDVYKSGSSEFDVADGQFLEQFSNCFDSNENDQTLCESWRYAGGFKFKKLITR